MKKTDVFPSRFFKADDVSDKPTLTIASADYEVLKNFKGKDEQKLVITFRKTKKQLIVNATIFDSIVEITNEPDSDDWPNHSVQLYATEVQVGTEMKPCVRVRGPDQAELKPKATATKRPVKPAKGEPDDMGDEIPWK